MSEWNEADISDSNLNCRSELNYCKYDKFRLKAMLIDAAMLSFLKIIDKQFGSGLSQI